MYMLETSKRNKISQEWVKLRAHTGSGLNGAVAAMVNGYLLVCGGYDGTNVIINYHQQKHHSHR